MPASRYDQGYADAIRRVKADLGAILRIHGIKTGEDNEEVISDGLVRDIFAGVFGVKAADDEFGPMPSGAGVRAKLARRG